QAANDKKKQLPGKIIGGGCATFSQHDIRSWDTTWFAFVLQAEYAWGDPRPLDDELKSFTDKFAAVFYGARDPEAAQVIASAYRDLDAVKSDFERNNYLIRDFIGVYDLQDKSYLDNNLEASLKLIDELAAKPQGPGKTIADIRQRCDDALKVAASSRQKLAGVASRVGNTGSMQHLISAPHKMENHARRTLFLLDLAAAFKSKDFANDDAQRAKLRKDSRALIDDTRVIADEMDLLMRGARLHADAADPSGYHKAITSLEAFDKRLAEPGEPPEKR
ncbi:MAG: hypothetical protein ABIP55_16005, partial [Tepidisphaeraceae bacterium]